MRFIDHVLGKLNGWACERCVVGEHHGVKICDANYNPNDDEWFLAKTKEALDLIKRVDSRRFGRILRFSRKLKKKRDWCCKEILTLMSGGA